MKLLFFIKTQPVLKVVFRCICKKTPETIVEKPGWRLSESSIDLLVQEDLDFVFVQAEKQLEGTIKEAEVILNRTSILLTIVVGLLVSIVGFAISNFESDKPNCPLIICCVLCVIYLYVLAFKLFRNLKGHKYITPGSVPVLLLDEYYAIKFPDNSKRAVRVKLAEAKSYQERIDQNKNTNKIRWSIFENTLTRMIYFPFFLAAAYILIKLLFRLF